MDSTGGVLLPCHPHPLRLLYGKLYCIACCHHSKDMVDYYGCDSCSLTFHKECAESPQEITYPYHPNHPLKLIVQEYSVDVTYRTCRLCGQEYYKMIYHCSICNFSVDPRCARIPTPFVIDYLKCHAHALTLLPRKISFTCNACGVIGDRCPFVCLRCDFMVHGPCIYLPRIIKIRFHLHRLSHTLALPYGKLSCGFCQKEVDMRYGGYSCIKGCPFVVHSECATKDGVWDGEELEGTTEESDEAKGLEPFKKIGDKVIHHFGHEHDLSLIEDSSVCNKSKRCQACISSISSKPLYSCIKCDYIIHEACAGLPRKLLHGLDPHPLTLHASLIPNDFTYRGLSICSSCFERHSGFMYVCLEGCPMELDIRCALISEPFIHGGHMHPLFFTTPGNRRDKICDGCGESLLCLKSLDCKECEFALDTKCATLPQELRHMHDDHALILHYGEDASDPYLCVICEEEMDPKKWFYACDECGFTSHVKCVLGSFAYVKPGQSFSIETRFNKYDFTMVLNNCTSRPLCCSCGQRCRDTLVAKNADAYYCSFSCIHVFWKRLFGLP